MLTPFILIALWALVGPYPIVGHCGPLWALVGQCVKDPCGPLWARIPFVCGVYVVLYVSHDVLYGFTWFAHVCWHGMVHVLQWLLGSAAKAKPTI